MYLQSSPDLQFSGEYEGRGVLAPHSWLDWGAHCDGVQGGEGAVAQPDGQLSQEGHHLWILAPDDSSYSRHVTWSYPSLLFCVILDQSVPVLKEQSSFPTTRKYSAAVGHPEGVLLRFCLWKKKMLRKKRRLIEYRGRYWQYFELICTELIENILSEIKGVTMRDIFNNSACWKLLNSRVESKDELLKHLKQKR